MNRKRKPDTIPPDVEALGSEAILDYRQMLKDGVEPKLAEMLACKQPSGGGAKARGGEFGQINPELKRAQERSDREIRGIGG